MLKVGILLVLIVAIGWGQPAGVCNVSNAQINNYVLTAVGTGKNCQWKPGSSGSGTVGSGTVGQFTYYPGTGTTVGGSVTLTDDGTNLNVTGRNLAIGNSVPCVGGDTNAVCATLYRGDGSHLTGIPLASIGFAPSPQAVTSGVTTTVTVPFNGTLSDKSFAVPSCVSSAGVGFLPAGWTNSTTQSVITFSPSAPVTGTCTAVIAGVGQTGSGGSPGATGPAGPINTIANAGTPLTQRATVNFLGKTTCVDNSGASTTDCTSTWGGPAVSGNPNATFQQVKDNPLTSGATTITVTSTTGWPTSGLVMLVDSTTSEIVSYSGVTSTTLTGVIRGLYGTTGASHALNKNMIPIEFISANSTSTVPDMTVMRWGVNAGNIVIAFGDVHDSGVADNISTAGAPQMLFANGSAKIVAANFTLSGGVVSATTGLNTYIRSPSGQVVNIADNFGNVNIASSGATTTLKSGLVASGLATTCTAQPTNTVAVVAGIFTLCP